MKFQLLLILSYVSCTSSKLGTDQANHFPHEKIKPASLPAKELFYLYILAGQSNMAGRGIVQPEDTLSSSKVLTLNQEDEWVYAKEPLHYYEPFRKGLDCGLSFGKTLSKKLNGAITNGIIPCAVGGSSIDQWLNDSTYRGVALYTNLMHKIAVAARSGTLKGMLWHQGESNASAKGYNGFKEKLKSFFNKLRIDLQQPELPVYTGQLGSFLSINSFPNAGKVNTDLNSLCSSMLNLYLVKTKDLNHMPDTVHFDSRSLRLMGQRFAKSVYKSGF